MESEPVRCYLLDCTIMGREWIMNSVKIMEKVTFGRQKYTRNGEKKLWLPVYLLQQIPGCEKMNDDYKQELVEKGRQQ
jgi:hypothetical protein